MSFLGNIGDYTNTTSKSESATEQTLTGKELKTMKFEMLVNDVNKNMIDGVCNVNLYYAKNRTNYTFSAKNILLYLFDENVINEIGRIIMNNSVIFVGSLKANNAPKIRERRVNESDAHKSVFGTFAPIVPIMPRFDFLVANTAQAGDLKSKVKESKQMITEFRVNRDEETFKTGGYIFLFWSLMILTVDESQQDKLPLICDFARMMNITDEEMMDLVNVIRYIYHKGQASAVKSDNVKAVFEDVLKMYDYS